MLTMLDEISDEEESILNEILIKDDEVGSVDLNDFGDLINKYVL